MHEHRLGIHYGSTSLDSICPFMHGCMPQTTTEEGGLEQNVGASHILVHNHTGMRQLCPEHPCHLSTHTPGRPMACDHHQAQHAMQV